ncbi:MAG: CHAT domain-containing tetratricopeptide repeat protein, partial [Bacteroidota bacterium]
RHARAAIDQFTDMDSQEWANQARIDLGNAHYFRQDYPSARRVYRQALAFFRAANQPDLIVRLLNSLAMTDVHSGNVAEATERFTRAFSIAQELNDPVVLASTLDNRAELHRMLGRHAAAVTDLRSALAEVVPDWRYSAEIPVPRPKDLATAIDRPRILHYLGNLARALVADGQLTPAREALAAADRVADLLRVEFGASLSKQFWRKEALPVYDLALQLSQQAGDLDGAFYYLEKSRSILLLESLLRAEATNNLPPKVSDRLSALTRRTQLLRQEISGAIDAKQDSLRDELVAASGALTDLQQQTAEEYPQLRELLVNPPVATLSEARQILGPASWDRQLTYFLGGDTARVLSLTPNEAQLYVLGSTATLEKEIRSLLDFYASPQRIDREPAAFLRESNRLYQRLLAPLGLPEGESLLIIPDGLLAYVPFSALVTDQPGDDLSGAPYLLRRHLLSYAPSATILGRQTPKKLTGENTAFAFSPFPEPLPGQDVPALPFSATEVEKLAGIYPTNSLLKGAATRQALLDNLGGGSIAHLSTHAYATISGEERPRILTATGPVYPEDIYGLQLNNHLITLSACESNIGPLAEGEGVLGLGRAFTAAGARGVIASLWSLNDRATADVTADFYARLASGTPKPRALHEAQLNYLQRSDLPGYLKSPYYWAGLTYYGNAGTLPAGGGLSGLVWSGLLIVGLVVSWLLLRRRSS